MKSDYSFFRNREARMHQMEFINKITLSMACLIFFFIGAPLGAIIRKGGLGIPVIISVIVFIIYYIFENTGMRMAREDNWTVLFGKLLGTAILTPVAIFFTYKANKDSTVFNIDMYRNIIFRIFGIRTKRHIYRKEVIINDPMYAEDVETLRSISDDASSYSKAHHLLKAPNAIKIFFYPGDDHEVENISNKLEAVIEDLSNTRDKIVLNELNNYPLINTNAHTRPFSAKWMNVVTGLIFPVGIFFYFRIWRFRLRLYKDMKVIRQTSDNIIKRIEERKTIFYK
jgi:lipopolysaccharide export system permease protein